MIRELQHLLCDNHYDDAAVKMFSLCGILTYVPLVSAVESTAGLRLSMYYLYREPTLCLIVNNAVGEQGPWSIKRSGVKVGSM